MREKEGEGYALRELLCSVARPALAWHPHCPSNAHCAAAVYAPVGVVSLVTSSVLMAYGLGSVRRAGPRST